MGGMDLTGRKEICRGKGVRRETPEGLAEIPAPSVAGDLGARASAKKRSRLSSWLLNPLGPSQRLILVIKQKEFMKRKSASSQNGWEPGEPISWNNLQIYTTELPC